MLAAVAFSALGWISASAEVSAQETQHYGPPYRHNSYADNGPHPSIPATIEAWWNDWKRVWPGYAHCGYSYKLMDPKTNGGKVVSMSPGRPCGGTAYGFATAYPYNPDKNLGPEKCSAPKTHCGNPINVAIGNKYQREDDLDAGPLLSFSRHYNSHEYRTLQEIGRNWRHTYSYRLQHMTDSLGLQAVVLSRPDGAAVVFDYVAGQWRADADVFATVVRRDDSSGQLVGWTYTARDGREVEQYDRLGRLILISRANGISVAFTYNGGMVVTNTPSDYLLTRVQSQDGRSLNLQYDSNLRVSKVLDPAGAEYVYAYDTLGRLDNVTYPGGAQRRYHYNETAYTSGLSLPNALTGITREDGQRYAIFTYGADGRAKSTEHAGGVDKFSSEYAADGSATITTPEGSVEKRHFSTSLGVKKASSIQEQCSGCATRTTSYTYDSNGYVDVKTDPRGVKTDYDHNVRGLTVQKIEAANDAAGRKRTVQTDWDAIFAVPTEQRVYDANAALVQKTTWRYNPRGQAIAVDQIAPSSNEVRTTEAAYCEQADVDAGTCAFIGMIKSQNGPRNDVSDITTYDYYSADAPGCATGPATCNYRKGDLRKLTNALGQSREVLRYDAAGRVLTLIDANGIVSDYEYNVRGWLVSRKVRGANDGVESDDAILRIEYEPTGLVKKLVRPDGSYLRYVYDAAQRLTDVYDDANNRIHYTLDNAGNRIKEDTTGVDGSLKRTLSSIYDQLGQLATSKSADGFGTGYTYDTNGNADIATDALGRKTDNDYDPLNRLVKTLQDAGGINAKVEYGYDALDRITKVTDPKGLDTSYSYNEFGDQTQLSSPDTGVTNYGYNAAGQVTSKQDANDAQAHTYTYDALGRAKTASYGSGNTDVEYDYDTVNSVCTAGETFAIGRVTAMRTEGTELKYCYDRFGQVVRKVQSVDGQSFTLRYAYTLAGQLQTLTYPDGAVADYVRDSQGRVNAIGVTPAGGVRTVLLNNATYEPFGPIAGWAYGNGRSLARTYDQDYRAKTILDSAAGGLSLAYGYNEVGELTELKDGLQSAFLAKYD
ncbi:DUF6531 domain-containing protein [Lysobacter antibioticus]|uniref:DUF6531 domain-containing protein n=1 Tax=Lysobacter antibioticus TaxID=84531 RepID=UPI0013778147|nr:DUF6531 domain-containing protein [Lysobacter antibioticus]